MHHRSLLCSEPFLLEVTPKAKAWLVEEGTDRQYGARPLKRVVEQRIVTPISHHICSDQIRKGDLITVDLDESGEAAELVRDRFEATPGLTGVEDTLPLPGIDWQLDVDVEAAGRYGVDAVLLGRYRYDAPDRMRWTLFEGTLAEPYSFAHHREPLLGAFDDPSLFASAAYCLAKKARR